MLVFKNNLIFENFLQKDRDPPSFYDIFNIYNVFDYGVTVQDINEMYFPCEKNIDIK